MNCASCGAALAAGDLFCGSCGARQGAAGPAQNQKISLDPQAVERMKDGAQAAAKIAQDLGAQVGKSSIFRGLLTLFVSFFMMPFKTMRLAGRMLREIGEKDALDEKTDHPHLTWITTVLPVIATIVFFGIMLFGTLAAIGKGFLSNSFSEKVSVPESIGLIIGSYLIAIIADWVIMLFGELLTRGVQQSRNVRTLVVVTQQQAADISKLAASASKRES